MSKIIDKDRFYYNSKFLGSPQGRSVRILSEYYGPLKQLQQKKIADTIVFFGSARISSQEDAQMALDNISKNADSKTIKRLNVDLKMSRYYEEARSLAGKFTTWSKGLKGTKRRYIICSGGGPGIMEASNRGAAEAGGINVGLTISLPFESSGNKWISDDLDMKFHYFFMRKFWFLYLAKALVVWPGGFGTLDELMECLTLIQTQKIKKRLPIVLYGKEFWENVVNWDYLVEIGTISEDDLNLFHISDDINDTFNYVTHFIEKHQLKGPNF
ncbi:MAG: LOG family protein [Candidatus Marinimicrobia bacterium]|jgi:hypothetical protein|nr:LOG family protein [Candidatus Neomarinimicrobiota bacterium]